jgi:hypothetical protein
MRPAKTRRSSRSETTFTTLPLCVKSWAPAASRVARACGPDVTDLGSATAATQARSQSSFLVSGAPDSVLQRCRISPRYEAMGRSSARNSSANEPGIHEYLRRCRLRWDVQKVHGPFEEHAPGLDVRPAVEFPHPVRSAPVVNLVPKPSEPYDAHVLHRLR